MFPFFWTSEDFGLVTPDFPPATFSPYHNDIRYGYFSYRFSQGLFLSDCTTYFRYEYGILSVQSVFELTNLPFSAVPFQNLQNTSVTGSAISYVNTTGDQREGKAISSVGYDVSMPTKDFEIQFDYGSNGAVGFANYLYAKYDGASLINLKMNCGLKKNNTQITLFYNEREVNTGFISTNPITLGLEYPDRLTAEQNGVKKYIEGVPVHYFADVNFTQSIRMVTTLSGGTVNVKYKPGNVFFKKTDFGTAPLFATTTDPSCPINTQNPTYLNKFDWRKQNYNIRIKENGQVNGLTILSPFRYNSEEFSTIAARYSPTGTYISGEDYESAAGWELIKADMGYNVDGTEKDANYVLEYPYFIMYNRLTNAMRVFLYLKNSSISNNLQVSLEATTSTGSIDVESKSALWSSFLQFKALNDPTLSIAEYAKIQKLKVNSGQFYYADFIMNYDPCIAFFESSIRLKVDYITQGDLKLVGRSLSSQVPAGTSQYSGLLENSKSFMTGVLKTPYGTQTNTLGDMTFNSLSDANTQTYSNAITGIVEGKKIEQWRKDVAQMRAAAGYTIATGETIDATATLMEGVAKIGTAADLTNISTKSLEGAAKMVSAAGKYMKAAGAYTNAAASTIEYNAIKNKDKESDQQIKLKAPEPRVSLVMGELALSGSVTITTPVFDNVYITTPGSKNANLAPEYYSNGSKGGKALYNEPMGSNILLFRPEFYATIVKNKHLDSLAMYIKTVKRPYVSTNDRSSGKMKDIIGVAIFVNTYNQAGVIVNTYYSDMYPLTSLPGDMDISSLINKKTIYENYNGLADKSATNVNQKMTEWVKIGYVLVNYSPSKLVQLNGAVRMGSSKMHYDGLTYFSFYDDPNTSQTSPINKAISESANFNFLAPYANDVNLGTNYRISNTDASFNQLMTNYCNSLNFASKNSKISDKETEIKTDTNLEINSNIESLSLKNSLEIYPNPSNGNFNVRYSLKENGKVSLVIYNLQGVKVIETSYENLIAGKSYISNVQMPSFSEKFYILRIIYPDGSIQNKRLIVN